MKFIYLGGPYKEYLGRLFAFKKPTEVTDKGTIAALLKNPDFMRVDDEPVARVKPAPLPVEVKRPILGIRRR